MALDYTRLTWQEFEALSCDLLFREGYRDIQPVGRSGEQGADALECQAQRGQGLCVWQFRRWTADYSDNKLKKSVKEEVLKLSKSGRHVRQFTIVWARDLGGSLRDQFARGQHIPNVGFDVRVLDEDWLDRRLRVDWQDLRRQYFGVPLETHTLTSLTATCQRRTRESVDRLIQEGKYVPELYIERQIDQTVDDFLRSEASSVLFVVDKAGSGKTCLACHSALSYSASRPVLLIPGQSLSLQYPDDLTKHVLSRLDYHDAANGTLVAARMDDLSGSLHKASQQLVVIIDAINECVGTGIAREALLQFTGEGQTIPIKLIVSCREAAWSSIDSLVWSARAYRVASAGLPSITHRTGIIPSDAASRAFDRYFHFFDVKASLGPNAWHALRHPLLLRLLCQSKRGQNLGHIDDCREQEVLTVFWEDQVARAADHAHVARQAIENALLAVAREMLEKLNPHAGIAALERGLGADVYIRDPQHLTPLLACLQQNLLAEGAEGIIYFSPEILGEYAVALSLLRTWDSSGFEAIRQACRRLAGSRRWWPVLEHLAELLPDSSDVILDLSESDPLAAARVHARAAFASDTARSALRAALIGQLERPYRLDRERACLALARLDPHDSRARVLELAEKGLVRQSVSFHALALIGDEHYLAQILNFGDIYIDFVEWPWGEILKKLPADYQERLYDLAAAWARDGDEARQLRGILALGFLRPENAVDVLSSVVEGEDPQWTGPAAYALAAIGSGGAVTAFFNAAERCDGLIREAMLTTGRGEPDEAAAQELVEKETGFHFETVWGAFVRTASDVALHGIAQYAVHDSWRIRYMAMRILQGRTSLEAVRGMLDGYDQWEKRAWGGPLSTWRSLKGAFGERCQLGDDVVHYLRGVVDAAGPTLAGRLAMDLLGKTRDVGSLPRFYAALTSDEPRYVHAGMTALADCGDAASVDAVAEAAHRVIAQADQAQNASLASWTAEVATTALGTIAAEEGVRHILALSQKCAGRHSTFWALGNYRTEEAAEAAAELAADVDREWGLVWATRALIRTCTESGIKAAASLVEKMDVSTRDRTAQFLRHGRNNESWWFPRQDRLRDGLMLLWDKCSDEGRFWLVGAFQKSGSHWAVETLAQIVKDTGGIPSDLAQENFPRNGLDYRAEAIEALIELGHPDFLAAVLAAVGIAPYESHYARALEHFSPALVADGLAEAVPGTTGPRLRMLLDYLGYVGAEKHVVLLESYLAATDEVRDIAYEAIDRIRGRGLTQG